MEHISAVNEIFEIFKRILLTAAEEVEEKAWWVCDIKDI